MRPCKERYSLEGKGKRVERGSAGRWRAPVLFSGRSAGIEVEPYLLGGD